MADREEPQVDLAAADTTADVREGQGEESQAAATQECANDETAMEVEPQLEEDADAHEKIADCAEEAQVHPAVAETTADVKEVQGEESQAEAIQEGAKDDKAMEVEPQLEDKAAADEKIADCAKESQVDPAVAETTADVKEGEGEEPQAEAIQEGAKDDEAMEVEPQLEDKAAADEKIADCAEEAQVDLAVAETAEFKEARGQEVQDMSVETAERQHQDTSKEIVGPPEASLPVEEVPVERATPEAKNRKRSVPSKASGGLEAIAAKVKRFREEADQAEAAIDEEVKKIEEWQAKVSLMRSEAAEKREAADRASKEYIKKQCEEAIAQLEADVPKRSPNAYIMFKTENVVQGIKQSEQNTQLAAKWANLAPEEKKKYQDRYAEASKRYNEWGKSEEGRRNLRERNELIQKAKSTGAEELGKAIEAIESGKTDGATKVTPAKRSNEAVETPTKDMPSKQRRVSAGKTTAPPKDATKDTMTAGKTTASAKEPFLDESILEEASKAGLAAQLSNLAARPEIFALGKSPQQLLDTLRSHNGMVNAAKRALLSA